MSLNDFPPDVSLEHLFGRIGALENCCRSLLGTLLALANDDDNVTVGLERIADEHHLEACLVADHLRHLETPG